MGNIPKKIHYCWFGRNPKPEIVEKCIKSWQKYMPDYEICQWNEDNYDCNKSAFMSEAYSQKKWAFVSDYARFDILNTYGGIYVDTDVEFLKPIPKEILKNDAFTGMEGAGNINPGLIFASVPNHPFLSAILNEYNNSHFVVNGNINYKTVNMFTTELLTDKGFVFSNNFQKIYDIAIYPSCYFCGYNQDIGEYNITPETISVHHYAGTWKKPSVKRKIQSIIKKIFGIKNYKRLLAVKRKLFGVYNK